jgi:amino acid transporter
MIGMTLLNLRGVRESIVPLVPVFLLFLVTHVLLIAGGILGHGSDLGRVAGEVSTDFSAGLSTLGVAGMAAVFARAYSLGGGTYTGIEAVSNGSRSCASRSRRPLNARWCTWRARSR